DFNDTINLICGLHDTLVLQITQKQWEAIGAFLSRETLAPTARRLRVDISTVSGNLKRGYYWQLAETVNRAGAFIERTFGLLYENVQLLKLARKYANLPSNSTCHISGSLGGRVCFSYAPALR